MGVGESFGDTQWLSNVSNRGVLFGFKIQIQMGVLHWSKIV